MIDRSKGSCATGAGPFFYGNQRPARRPRAGRFTWCLFFLGLGEIFLHGGFRGLVAAVGHDNAAVGLGAGGEGGHVGMILQGRVDDVALIGVHRLERDVAAVAGDLAGDLLGQTLQRLLALEAIAQRRH